jgi:hypothetical protein
MTLLPTLPDCTWCTRVTTDEDVELILRVSKNHPLPKRRCRIPASSDADGPTIITQDFVRADFLP